MRSKEYSAAYIKLCCLTNKHELLKMPLCGNQKYLIAGTGGLTPIKEAGFAQEELWGRCGKYQVQPKA